MKLSKRLRKWRKNITVQTPLDYVLVLQEDIMGFANEVKALEAENKKLRALVRDMWWTMVKAAWDGEQPSLTEIRERIDDAGVEVDG